MSAIPFLFTMFDNDGDPISGGQVDTFVQNTTTRIAVYTSSALSGGPSATNPALTNAAGRVFFYFDSTIAYTFNGYNADRSEVIFQANVTGGFVTFTFIAVGNAALNSSVWEQDYKTADNTWQDARNLAVAAAQSTGFPLVLAQSTTPTAQPTTIGEPGISIKEFPGGSTITPTSAADYSAIKYLGSGVSLTLASTSALGVNYIDFVSASGIVAGQVVEVVLLTNEAWASHVRYISGNRLYFDEPLPFEVTTSNTTSVIVWFTPVQDISIKGIIRCYGDGLTSTSTVALSIGFGVNLDVEHIEGFDLHTDSPTTTGHAGGTLKVAKCYGSRFGKIISRDSGAQNGGDIRFTNLYNSSIEEIVSDQAYNVGPHIDAGRGNSFGIVKAIGTRGRGFKFETEMDFYVGHAESLNAGATGAGFVSSRGRIGYLKAGRQRLAPVITSIVVVSNVATVTFAEPHTLVVGSTFVISGATEAPLNATHTVVSIVGSPLTSTVLTVAVTSVNENPAAGSPVWAYYNPTVWFAGGNTVVIDTLELTDAGYSAGADGRDIYTTTTDLVIIGNVVCTTTPTLGGSGVEGVNIIIERINGVFQPLIASANSDFAALRVRNLSAGASAYTSIYLGNNSGATRAGMFLQSSANSGIVGAGGAAAGTFADVEFALLRNSLPRVRVNSADVTIVGELLPAVTETYDLGSTSFEWDNAFLQNAVTVCDFRLKDHIGDLDGIEAIAFIEALSPAWFSHKNTIVPAHMETRVREIEVRNETTGEIEIRHEPYQAEIPERIISHRRPHTGIYAQDFKAAMDKIGWQDWAGYAYDPKTDTHVTRLNEQIAVLTAAVKYMAGQLRGAGILGGLKPVASVQSPPADGLGAGVPSPPERADVGEPIPDPLREVLDAIVKDEQFATANPDLTARLLSPDPDEEARKAALMQRLIDLGGLQSLGALSPAGWAEFNMLTQYASWFK